MLIELNGATLAYDDFSPEDPDSEKKPALVFSHSHCMSRTMYSNQVDFFSGDRRVVCYDHRGQGWSSRDAAARLDMDTLTADAAMLIEELELAPCHFVGSAMGGFIALRLAARRPDLLSSAIVVCSSIKGAVRGVPYPSGVQAELRNISMPLLLISGAEDITCPPEFSDVIAAFVEGARHVRIERAGHTVVLEQPDLVNRLIAEHVEACDPS